MVKERIEIHGVGNLSAEHLIAEAHRLRGLPNDDPGKKRFLELILEEYEREGRLLLDRAKKEGLLSLADVVFLSENDIGWNELASILSSHYNAVSNPDDKVFLVTNTSSPVWFVRDWLRERFSFCLITEQEFALMAKSDLEDDQRD